MRFCRSILIKIGPLALLVLFGQHKSLTNDVIAKFLHELSKPRMKQYPSLYLKIVKHDSYLLHL